MNLAQIIALLQREEEKITMEYRRLTAVNQREPERAKAEAKKIKRNGLGLKDQLYNIARTAQKTADQIGRVIDSLDRDIINKK